MKFWENDTHKEELDYRSWKRKKEEEEEEDKEEKYFKRGYLA